MLMPWDSVLYVGVIPYAAFTMTNAIGNMNPDALSIIWKQEGKMKHLYFGFLDLVPSYLCPISPAIQYMYLCCRSPLTVFDLYDETVLEEGQCHKDDAYQDPQVNH